MSTEERVTVPVVTMAKQPAGTIEVPAEVVQSPPREHLLYEVVKAHQAARRSGTASTKTRGNVRGGGSSVSSGNHHTRTSHRHWTL